MAHTGQFLYLKTARHRVCMRSLRGPVPLLRCYSVASGEGLSNNERTRKIRKVVEPRPRAVDARSLAAPRTGSQGTLLRSPKLRLRGQQSRRPGFPTQGANSKTRATTKRTSPARDRRQPTEEEGDDVRAAELEDVLSERKSKAQSGPVRYTPVQYDASKLQETWPSLPIGTTANTGSVLEKMNLMSRRYANGYVPPHELAKRLFEGDRVFFHNEEEKKEAIEEFKKLAQQRADKLTQRKGDLVEPEDINFVSTSSDEKSALVGQLVQGNYARWTQDRSSHPVLGEVERQLFNNETYRSTGKQSEFITKFQSLLASAQPVKRTGN